MTGIPTVSDLAAFIYETLVFCCLTGFAAYDIRTRRVPDRALVFFCPAVLASLPVHMQGTGASFQSALGFSLAGCAAGFLILLTAALSPVLVMRVSYQAGCAVGFLILLTAALLSKGGAGVGGGDIKLAAATGFIYGPYRMLGILMLAALLSACAALITLCRLRGKAKRLSLPFVPFIAAGSLITLIISMT